MTLQALQREVADIRIAKDGNPVFKFLVDRFPPREIHAKTEHSAYLKLASALMRLLARESDERASDGIRMYLDILSPFIERFEEKHWPPAHVHGRDMLAFLMDQHGLKQDDLGKEIGAQPYVSDILRGKKKLTAEQMAKLAKRFQVSPSIFFDD